MPQATEEASCTLSTFTHVHGGTLIAGPRIFLPGEIPDPTPGMGHGRTTSPEGVPFHVAVSWSEHVGTETHVHYVGLDEAQVMACLDPFPASFLRPFVALRATLFDRCVLPWHGVMTEHWYDPEHVGATFIDAHGETITDPDPQSARLSLSWTAWHDDGQDQPHLHVLTIGREQVQALLRGFPPEVLKQALHRTTARALPPFVRHIP